MRVNNKEESKHNPDLRNECDLSYDEIDRE